MCMSLKQSVCPNEINKVSRNRKGSEVISSIKNQKIKEKYQKEPTNDIDYSELYCTESFEEIMS